MGTVEFNPPMFPNLEVELTLAGWTYRQYAQFLSLTDVAVSERMRGKREFKLDEMLKTSKLFNKSVEELFTKSNVKG